MRGRTPSIKSLFRGRLVAAGIVVVLAAACAQFVHSAALLREAVRQRLTVTAELGAAQIADFIAHHQAAVSLCAARHTLEPDGRRALFELRERFPAFLTVRAADAEGRILHGEPQLRADGEAPFRWAGHAVADRDYFRVPMRTGRPYVSDVFVGRGYGDDPIIALSAPMFDARGRVNGIVEGSIASPAFAAARAEAMARRGMALLVLDRRGRVVHATRDLRLRALQSRCRIRTAARSASASAGRRSSRPRAGCRRIWSRPPTPRSTAPRKRAATASRSDQPGRKSA